MGRGTDILCMLAYLNNHHLFGIQLVDIHLDYLHHLISHQDIDIVDILELIQYMKHLVHMDLGDMVILVVICIQNNRLQ